MKHIGSIPEVQNKRKREKKMASNKDPLGEEVEEEEDPGGGGTLGISGWGCATRTLEPLAYTRASFSWILPPYTRVNSWFP